MFTFGCLQTNALTWKRTAFGLENRPFTFFIKPPRKNARATQPFDFYQVHL